MELRRRFIVARACRYKDESNTEIEVIPVKFFIDEHDKWEEIANQYFPTRPDILESVYLEYEKYKKQK